MYEFIDRIPGDGKANRKKITYEDGSSVYATIENADDANPAGTPLNRAALMAVQGFQPVTTIFNADESITETGADGAVLKTVFNADGSITETFTKQKTITKTTYFDSDTQIREEITQ